jgi:hypothetical protein
MSNTLARRLAPDSPDAPRARVLESLRERILEKQGGPRAVPSRLDAVLPAIESWLGAWPRPGVTELVGAPGSGRLALILPSLAALTRAGRPVVVIDAMEQLYPPGWATPWAHPDVAGAAGCDLGQLWVVRPGLDRAAWAAEQVARSGAVEALLLLDAPRLGRAGLRLARAAEQGGSALFVVAEEAEAELPAAMRLHVGGYTAAGRVRVRCTRARDGRAVGERELALGGRASAAVSWPSPGRPATSRH